MREVGRGGYGGRLISIFQLVNQVKQPAPPPAVENKKFKTNSVAGRASIE